MIDRLRETVEALCAPVCRGRAPGTPGGRSARQIVLEGLQTAGVESAGEEGWLQPIPTHGGANVLGLIRPTGSLAKRVVLVGAHYDHLGVLGRQVYPGADDNGSGVAVLLDVARSLMTRRDELHRSVLLVSFDAEEMPYYLQPDMGSMYFVEHPPVPLERIDMMIALDVVGHAIGDATTPERIRRSILCVGAERSEGSAALIDGLGSEGDRLPVLRLDSYVVPPLSDHYAFEQAGIPFLFFTCGRDGNYHTPWDTPEKLDYDKLAAFSGYLADLVVALSRRPEGSGRFLEQGRDDPATIATLSELVAATGQPTPELESIGGWVDQRRAEVEEGRLLTEREQMLATAALMEVESQWGFPSGI